jgi:general nucleoside transport system permease protein
LADAARAITPTPTPNPSPQGGGARTEIAAPLSVKSPPVDSTSIAALRSAFTDRVGGAAEYVVIPVLALVAALAAFGVFVALFGRNPLDLYFYMYQGAFGTWFSWQNTLSRAAPLILTALCTALPAQLGLVIIGGEGALLMGALAATSTALLMPGAPPFVVQMAMVLSGMTAGGLWIALSGGLQHYRGVNETISSLLLVYIALAILNQLVEGPMRDPSSLNKPSSHEIGAANMLGTIPGTDVHWGLVFGIVAAILCYILIYHTAFGFAARVAGGNVRAAKVVGLGVGRLILIVCFLAGAAAGLAGMVEVAAVQGRTNANLAAGYGFTGILVAFLARHNPLAVIPVAILLGGINASGGLLQRRLGLPDASVLVLQGMIFISVLASETLYGRFRIFRQGP